MAQRDERDEPNGSDYPLGRGYGHDYMRGGEVNGGYGYSERDEYPRPRGSGSLTDEDLAAVAAVDPMARLTPSNGASGVGASPAPDAPDAPAADAGAMQGPAGEAPVPQLEHTFGDTGSAWRHSRSFYVTQAQLQQRFYATRRDGPGPYDARLRTLRREDDALRKDVQEALFFDTWVDANAIAVEVREGVVTLRGTLPSQQESRYAVEDAWSVAGVREVRNELRVAPG